MKDVFSKNNTLLALAVLSVFQLVLISTLWVEQSNLKKVNRQEFDTLQQNITSANNGLAYKQVTVSPKENRIYLPQLNISFPVTSLGLALLYSPDTAYVTGSNKTAEGPADEASISLFGTASASQSQTQFNCSSLVRIRFEPKPNPNNPNEHSAGSVALENGKTLQIYSNHLKDCQREYDVYHANPDTVANLFKQAESY